MKTVWCDTETTGVNPENSGAFQVAFLVADTGKVVCEKTYYLNPLTDKILYHPEAAEIHGVSEEQIRDYALPKDVVPVMVDFLKSHSDGDRMTFAGYNCDFDYRHVNALFVRCGYNLSDYFASLFDVFDFVKKASKKRVIPWLENLKLGTVCKAMGVPLENAHDALADIRATRSLCIKLYEKGVKI